jgi:hypothetical protein
VAILTKADETILPMALRQNGGFAKATEWYLMGWKPLPYQYAWHHVLHLNATCIGGVAVGKTTMEAASNTIDCLTIPHFKALNTSVTAKQAELPFMMFMSWYEGNKNLAHLVRDIRLRPWPIVTFENFATYEFRTAGLDARFIRGFEYDRINYDECALDPLGRTAEVLRTRLRGTRPNGETRMARLDTVTSPGAVLWLKERFEKGFRPEDKRLYFSMRIKTWDNTHLTQDQIDAMMAEMPPEIVAVEMGAEWPNYGSAYFPERYVDIAIDQDLYDDCYISLNPENEGEKPKLGYELEEDARIGTTKFSLPYIPGNRYIIAGDPGKGNPPHRNAGVVLVADVTQRPYRMVHLNWVAGNGAIRPWIQAYKNAIDIYQPERKGLDVTGTQEYMDEIAFQEAGISTDGISYSADKYGMLNMLLYDLQYSRWRVPPIAGLIRQTKTYSLEADREDRGLAQDLVTTWAQLSWLAKDVPRDVPEVRTEQSKLDYARRMRPVARVGRHTPTGRRRR